MKSNPAISTGQRLNAAKVYLQSGSGAGKREGSVERRFDDEDGGPSPSIYNPLLIRAGASATSPQPHYP